MLSHLFRLIWNKKKQNFLLMLEMFVSFLVMFAVFTLLVYYYNNYKQEHGFEYENVWAVNYNDAIKPGSNDSVAMYTETIRQTLKAVDGVEDVTFTSSNVPFSFNTMNSTVAYKGNELNANIFDVEDNYHTVLQLKLLQGRWFNNSDISGTFKPVVINEKLKQDLFGKDDAIGKVITEDKQQMKIIGVAANMKTESDYQATENGIFKRLDSNEMRYNNTMLVKVKEDAGAAFEARLYKVLNNAIKNANIEIEHITTKRDRKNALSLVPMIILTVVGGFLIINVALGLFGVLWYNINKRRGEIGLRRAKGASGSSVSWQLIGEAMVLATLSLIVGSFFAIQFPLMNVFDLPSAVYFTALALAIVFIYILVMICAWYPGKQAAAIYPAVALHEE